MVPATTDRAERELAVVGGYPGAAIALHTIRKSYLVMLVETGQIALDVNAYEAVLDRLISEEYTGERLYIERESVYEWAVRGT